MLKQILTSAAIGLALASAALPVARATETIPIEAFTNLPFIQQVSVSRDGKHMAMVRGTSKSGDYIIEIYKTDDLSKKPVRLGAEKMEIQDFGWVTNDRLHVSFRVFKDTDQGGGSHWAYTDAIVNANGKGKWMYLPKAAWGPVLVQDYLPLKPDEILLSLETDDVYEYNPDLVLFNVRNGRTRAMISGTTKMGDFFNDWEGEIRGALGFEPSDGSIKYYARLKGESGWKLIKTITPDAETREDFAIIGFSKDEPNKVYVRANNGEDKAGIYLYDLTTDTYSERLFGLKSVDAGGVLRSGKLADYGHVKGFTYTTDTRHYYFTDTAEGALYKAVQDLFPNTNTRMVSRSEDDNAIVIYTSGAQDPGTYYLLKDKSRLEKIGEEFPLIDKSKLADQEYVTYKARDGMEVPAYITKPKGDGPFPAVVLPHGGPWARDIGGYDEWAQLLASRGYVVIQPNYRGSDGYGLAHWKAGDKNWGLTMQDDLDDAAFYLIGRGLATKDKLAMFGWSYGGYAAFAASMRENNIYQCSVAGAGVSNLNLLNAGIYGSRYLRKLQRPTIDGVSPVEHVDKVNIPIFVVHGDADQRVPVEHSRQFVDKLKDYRKDYKYSEMKDLDHFYNTFSHEHKEQFFHELTDYLASDKCFGK